MDDRPPALDQPRDELRAVVALGFGQHHHIHLMSNEKGVQPADEGPQAEQEHYSEPEAQERHDDQRRPSGRRVVPFLCVGFKGDLQEGKGRDGAVVSRPGGGLL